ncbi:MAG: zinc-ribbon domain-containing protein [Lachnospiraceae bacterium]|nr:zinc-ribbon domain-containing protein [Lachnospiraceae bacterium]
MYCRRCGREIPDDAMQCSVCGTPTNGEYRPNGINEQEAENVHHEGGYGYSYSNPTRYQDPMRQPGDRRGLAIAALVFGILSLVVCCVPLIAIPAGLAAIIMGALSVKSSGQGFAIAGIVLGVIGLILGISYVMMSLFIYSNIDFDAIMNEMEMYY